MRYNDRLAAIKQKHPMKNTLKSLLTALLSPVSAFPTERTRATDVQGLVRRLHPVASGHALIRLGPAGDGGYLVPDDLDGIAACFSPGVSRVSGFEKDCASRGMDAYMADKSVDGPADAHPRFHFRKKFLGATSNNDYMRLDDWVTDSLADTTSDLMLQMDIEGFEYEVLLSATPALLQRFRVIVIEFHQLDQLWNRPWFLLASRVFDSLLQTHACVHIHPNNCRPARVTGGLAIPPMMEFSFLRRDRMAADGGLRTDFPHPLDIDNTRDKPLVLPSCWYGGH